MHLENEAGKDISEEFSDQWQTEYYNIALLSIESSRTYEIDLECFVDEFDSRHDNRRIKLHWILLLPALAV